jgi:Asp-tRNA(Asn)/Glu-tRNA(Gln) amidotransferase A subunit family amidase
MDVTRDGQVRVRWGLLLCVGWLLGFGAVAVRAEESAVPDPGPALEWLGLRFPTESMKALREVATQHRKGIDAVRQRPVDPARPQTLVFRPWNDAVPARFTEGYRWEPPVGVKRPADREALAWMGVAELSALVRARVVSSEELTVLAIERLKRFDGTLHAVVNLTEARALESARRADAEIRAGKWRGPLHGIPYGAKDLLDVQGVPTTWGVGVRSNAVAASDATVIARLEAAGAVLVAKLSLGELAMGDVWFGGKTRNPWAPADGSSGSSAGSASAVSAGLVPFAIGSETLGSIVSPSTVCGVTGLRPTFGRVPRTGAMTLCPSMDKLGVLARTAEDAALVFEVIRGPDGKDLSVAPAGFEWDNRAGISGMRIGVLGVDLRKDKAGWTNHAAVMEWMRGAGAVVEEVTLPPFAGETLGLILMAEASASFEAWVRDGRMAGLVQQDPGSWPNLFRAARLIPAVEYLEANRGRGELAEAMEALLARYDAVLAPAWVGDTLVFSNYSGHPSVVMPDGAKLGSRPATVCLVGRWFGETAILRVARAWQQGTAWHQARPPGF